MFLGKRQTKTNSANLYTLSALEQRISDDVDWAQRSPEVREQHGKLVAIHNKKIIAVGTDRAALLQHAARATGFPAYEFAVVVVPSTGLWEIPH
jgi:hypothetical protein